MNPPEALRAAVRHVPDFPKPGILFKDITPILLNAALLRDAIDRFVFDCEGLQIEKIAGIEARGFLFGAAMADRMGLPFVPIRKKGKLPWKTEGVSYDLEYGSADIEVHADAFLPGERVALIDDLLATGGTAGAAIALIEKLGAIVVQAQFLIELEDLPGRQVLSPCLVKSIITF